MAEPTSSAAAAAAAAGTITLTALLPGIDGEALIGAFAGASLFAIANKDSSIVTRLAYMLISWVIGYFAAPDVISHTPITAPVVAAFIPAALVITAMLTAMDRIKRFDVAALWKKGN